MTAPPTRSTRRWLLTSNAELRADGVFAWTLPAFAGRLPDGRTYNTCPEASACADLCYARSGTYRFSNVLAAHQRNLLMVLDSPWAWEVAMKRELQHRRYRGAIVRVHDSGDFFSDDYLTRWVRIMNASRQATFYAYTKAVTRFRRIVEPDPPANFRWVYSLGGKEDHLLDLDTERHADVFPSAEAIGAAGYADQSRSDVLAVAGPPKVGIPANNIRHLLKRQAGRSFGELQRARDAQLTAKKGRHHGPTDDRQPVPPSAAG
ncbi:GP88 family protein [Streptomyces albidoflavus]